MQIHNIFLMIGFLSLSTYMHAQNLVTNGCFDTGDFTGWFLIGSGSAVIPGGVHGCTHQAELKNNSFFADHLVQSISTVSGEQYTINFSLASMLSVLPNEFAVSWDGTTLLFQLNQTTTQPYTTYTFTQPASTNSTTLDFTFATQGTTDAFFLDAISVFLIVPPLPLPMINTSNVSGNNKTFANYLNNNAPSSVLQLFASLQGNALQNALESASPARTAFVTYSTQTTFMGLSQLASDHLRQKRFHGQNTVNSDIPISFKELEQAALIVDASDNTHLPTVSSRILNCQAKSPYTAWMNILGEYTHERAQSQTPAFNASAGGVIAGFDYNSEHGCVLGGGAAYAHTHVHEKNGAGHADTNQGYLNFLTTLTASKWYFDLGIWGGYYHVHNLRKISFPGFHKNATSKTHGWQLAPHLEIGYDSFLSNHCVVKKWGIEPFTVLDWVSNWEHGFREHGGDSLNMTVKKRYSSFLRSETGFRFHESCNINWGQLVFLEKVSYAYQKAFHTGKINSFLTGSPGTFTVTTLGTGQNLGVLELALYFLPSAKKAPYVNISYQGEFGSSYHAHQGRLEIGKDF